jgi:phage repressor protein C with HTH and peptisase S24 domain
VEIARNQDGESMMPVLFPGDIVLVDTDDPKGDEWKFKEGAVYAVRTRRQGDCSIKRVYKDQSTLILASDNRARRPKMAWTNDLEKLIIGRVVWGWRNLLEA